MYLISAKLLKNGPDIRQRIFDCQSQRPCFLHNYTSSVNILVCDIFLGTGTYVTQSLFDPEIHFVIFLRGGHGKIAEKPRYLGFEN
jgi:hypothetical protein